MIKSFHFSLVLYFIFYCLFVIYIQNINPLALYMTKAIK